MKKTTLLFLFLGCLTLCYGQPKISNLSFPKDAGVFELYELSFNLGNYSNPYDPEVIDVWAEFNGPDGKRHVVTAFYYEAYSLKKKEGYEVATHDNKGDRWKLRFTPDIEGYWTFVLHARDKKGEVVKSSDDSGPLAFKCRVNNNAQGFIRKANSLFLKREVRNNGKLQYRSFFPVGPNVAWYGCADAYHYEKPYGIYEYKDYIDALSGNANYMRVWLNRYQYLSLYGPEHTIRSKGLPTVFFDAMVNQKDAAEVDYIVSYAAEHGINIMPCIFTKGDFKDEKWAVEAVKKYSSMPSAWTHNPFHTQLGLEQPIEFFTNPEAKRIVKNLLRYIVSRWGYATNLVSWELWNEVGNMFKANNPNAAIGNAIAQWHAEMASYVRSIDPYDHLITTSLGDVVGMENLFVTAFDSLDIVQNHLYENLQKAKSREQMPYVLLLKRNEARQRRPDKPFFMGEYGLNSTVSDIDYYHKDPQGVDLHNSTWASLFSCSAGPASFWYWQDLSRLNKFDGFRPVKVFCDQMPLLSDNFSPATTGKGRDRMLVFPNNLQTYYMKNQSEDTLFGWCQDTAFCYQSLRRLTESVASDGHFILDGKVDTQGYLYTLDPQKRPAPSSRRNTVSIPIENQPRGTRYVVRWFDPETGREWKNEATTAVVRRRWIVRKYLNITFPSSVRDTKDMVINNTFGDAVFVIYKE